MTRHVSVYSFLHKNHILHVDLYYVESPVAVLSRSGELMCSDLSLKHEMVRKLNKKAPKKKSRGSFTGYLHGRDLIMKSTWRSMALEETVFRGPKCIAHFLTMLYNY